MPLGKLPSDRSKVEATVFDEAPISGTAFAVPDFFSTKCRFARPGMNEIIYDVLQKIKVRDVLD